MHAFEELSHKRSNQNVDRADLPVDLDWEHDISVFHWLEGGVHQGLVQVEDESLATSLRWPLRPKQVLIAVIAVGAVLDLNLRD